MNATLIAEAEEARREMHLLSLRIRLKLNPTEQPHIDFINMIERLRLERRPENDTVPDELARAGQDLMITDPHG